MNEELTRFVREALVRGASRAQIGEALSGAGWRRGDIDKALAAFEDREFVLPVPRPRPYLGAREAFLYLVLFASLYTAAISIGNAVFVLINRAFPDAAFTSPASVSTDVLRWALSFLIVSFPLFLFIQRTVNRMLQKNPELHSSRIRKWLTYMTLFLAAGVLVGDGIAVLYYALGGELGWRFVLKVIVVGAIAGSVFGYYRFDLRRDDADGENESRRPRLPLALAGGWSVAVMLVVAGGLSVSGSPGRARERILDMERVFQLQSIVRGVDVYWERTGALPESLDALALERDLDVRSTTDPASGENYVYRLTGDETYELCAVFARAAPTDPASLRVPPYQEVFWRHAQGDHCFDLEAIDPDARRW